MCSASANELSSQPETGNNWESCLNGESASPMLGGGVIQASKKGHNLVTELTEAILLSLILIYELQLTSYRTSSIAWTHTRSELKYIFSNTFSTIQPHPAISGPIIALI